MRTIFSWWVWLLCAACALQPAPSPPLVADVCVYGATAAGVVAALQVLATMAIP
jgi:hypothetical protein